MSIYRRVSGSVWRALPVGVVVRRPGPAADALMLTGHVGEVWRALDGPRTIDALLCITPSARTAVDTLVDAGLVTDEDQLQ